MRRHYLGYVWAGNQTVSDQSVGRDPLSVVWADRRTQSWSCLCHDCWRRRRVAPHRWVGGSLLNMYRSHPPPLTHIRTVLIDWLSSELVMYPSMRIFPVTLSLVLSPCLLPHIGQSPVLGQQQHHQHHQHCGLQTQAWVGGQVGGEEYQPLIS